MLHVIVIVSDAAVVVVVVIQCLLSCETLTFQMINFKVRVSFFLLFFCCNSYVCCRSQASMKFIFRTIIFVCLT